MPISNAVREVFKKGRDDNPASWRWIIAFYEYVITLPVWGERHLPLLRLVHQVADGSDAANFRAGQSLHDLVISTQPQNGLAEDDPYIRVGPGAETAMFDIEYWRGGNVGDLMEGHTVPESQAMSTLKPLLARLRSEAKVAVANAPKE